MKRQVKIISSENQGNWYARSIGQTVTVTEDQRYPDLWLMCPQLGVLSLEMLYIKKSDCKDVVIDEPKELNDLLFSIGKWGDATFPNRQLMANGWRNPMPTFFHLTNPEKGEIWELKHAIETCDQKNLNEEIADCAILLFHIAYLTNVNLYQAINSKMAINRNRVWGTPDENGIIYHKKNKVEE